MTDRPRCACSLPWKVCCWHYAQLSLQEQDRVRSGLPLFTCDHDREQRERVAKRRAS